MKKDVVKRIITLIVILFFSIEIPLNQAAYSFEIDSQNDQNSKVIEVERDVRVQDDFYEAINKNWLRKTTLENGYVSYGTFEEVCGRVNNDIHNIILDIQKNKNTYYKNSEELKVLNLYNSYLDMGKRNELGIKPIEKYINKINEVENLKDLKEILINNEFSYFQSLINLGVGPDYKDTKVNVLYISNSSLGLGNSFYYKQKSNSNEKIRGVYIDYLTKLHMLYKEDEKTARRNAEIFYEIENNIANKIPSYEEDAKDDNRIQKSYNVYTLEQLKEIIPNIDISDLLKKLNIKYTNKIVVENPEELELINSFVVKENIERMKIFLKTSVLLNSDNLLTSNFREVSNEMKKVLYGVDNIDLNEGSAVKFVCCQLNEVMSKLYVNRYVEENSKEDVENMTKEIIETFKNRLGNISWMSKSTREEAINKLNNVNVKIGYPDKWNDYGDLEIRSYEEGGTLVDNIIKIYMSQSKREFDKLNHPVNKNEWSMGACTVNAYYNALNNEIVFPAGILQPPFYEKSASREKNLGGIGIIIGHELTHAFDNTGAQFDYTGRYKNWWDTCDYKEFTNRSRKIAEYYSNIEISEGNFINGFLTVGENISDLGGVACVIDIAKKIENPNLKDLFENYAIVWREISTKEFKEYLLNNDLHAPKKIRVNAVLSQFEEFYQTYNINKEDKMYVNPEDRVGIW